jgi:hypothetical protein
VNAPDRKSYNIGNNSTYLITQMGGWGYAEIFSLSWAVTW